MRKMSVLMVLLLVLSLGALQVAAQDDETPQLTVLNWQGYGSDEPWAVEMFEEEYGVEVVHDYYTSLDEMLTKLRTSPDTYDVIQMNIAYIRPAVEDELIVPLPVDDLTAWESLPESFQTLPEISQDTENIYGIPWTWGATGLAYNTEVFPDGVESLDVLWDEEYAGQIGMIDGYEEAVILSGLEAGIEQPVVDFYDNEDDIAANMEALVANSRTFWQSEDEFNRLFEAGEITLGIFWSGSASRSQTAFELPMGFVIPEEGAIGWIDTWEISADTDNFDVAIEWLNFMNSPEFYLEWDEVAGAPVPANSETLNQLPEDSFTLQVFGDPEVAERLVFQGFIDDEQREEMLLLWQEAKLLGGG